MPPFVNRLLREPLVHFLAIGLLLFLLFALVSDDQRDSGDRIEITDADVEQLVAIFRKQWQRSPNPQELQSLIDSRVREEVLYREALALGLEKDDTIVRRRLAQKVEFLMGDAGGVAEPDDTTLQAYYDENAERYREPPRLSFSHIYFNTDRRGEQAQEDARALLARLRAASPRVTQALDEGDPFMLPRVYVDKRTDEIARDFGRAFTEQMTGLQTKQWHGPVTSAYGLHLVYIGSREEASQPELDQVRSRVTNDWLVEQRQAADKRIYERLRSRYEISVVGQQDQEE
ncbi:MAG: peptidyl-prolyl cis-trans isomerase [Betaproteobacteria bacterium]|nr:MAG: peptidyl-prolyl cis-trans isomerase [Betaproteobacteria bacterium]